MKLNHKHMTVLCIFLVVFVIVTVVIINYGKDNHKKKVSNTPSPTSNGTPLPSEKETSQPEITTADDALAVVERLYHEEGYEFKIKTVNEQEIIVEKVNKNTSQVETEFSINIQDQTIVTYQSEQIAITAETKSS